MPAGLGAAAATPAIDAAVGSEMLSAAANDSASHDVRNPDRTPSHMPRASACGAGSLRVVRPRWSADARTHYPAGIHR